VDCSLLVSSDFTIGHIGGIMAALRCNRAWRILAVRNSPRTVCAQTFVWFRAPFR